MSQKPPIEEEMQVVEQYVRSFRTPLVPLASLYSDLEDDGMDHILVSRCLMWLEHKDRIWMLHVDKIDEEEYGLPCGGYGYIPYDGMNEPLTL